MWIAAFAGIMLMLPVIALFGAVVRALVLSWPVMLLLGAIHNVPELNWVPPLGFWATMGVVAVLGLLIPTGDSSRTDTSTR
jgi:hypothetical protein